MSSPYVQVEIDAIKKAALLASALGVQLREAVGGLTLMWAHIYGEGRSSVVTAFYLRTFFGVDGGLVAEALVELGFLESCDGGWRVKGAGRYTRLAEVRREAGRKGAEVTNRQKSANAAAKVGKRSANADSEEASDGTDEPPTSIENDASDGRQLPAKGPSKVGKCRGKTSENDVLPRQKAALDPRSDISPPTGEREISEIGRSSRATSEPAPPPDGGRAEVDHGAMAPKADPPPPRPDRPTAVYGTPEWREAEGLGNWPMLAWACYPGETEAERKLRVAPNAAMMQRELDERRAAEEAAWNAEQARKAAAKAQAAVGAS